MINPKFVCEMRCRVERRKTPKDDFSFKEHRICTGINEISQSLHKNGGYGRGVSYKYRRFSCDMRVLWQFIILRLL